MTEIYGIEHLLRLFGEWVSSGPVLDHYLRSLISLVSISSGIPPLCPAVRIGSMLAYTPMDDDSLALLLSHIHDFLKSVTLGTSCLCLFTGVSSECSALVCGQRQWLGIWSGFVSCAGSSKAHSSCSLWNTMLHHRSTTDGSHDSEPHLHSISYTILIFELN